MFKGLFLYGQTSHVRVPISSIQSYFSSSLIIDSHIDNISHKHSTTQAQDSWKQPRTLVFSIDRAVEEM